MADAEEEADMSGAAGHPAAVELVMKGSIEDVRRSLTLEDVQWRSSVGDSLLCYAARRPEEVGDAGKVCRHLVEALGLPVGEVSKWNQNPLFYAAKGGIPEAIAYLRIFLEKFYRPTASKARATDGGIGPVDGNGSRLEGITTSSGPLGRMSILSAPAPAIMGGRRCFLSGTLLKSCAGQFWKVEEIQEGSYFISAKGQRLQVIGHVVHDEDMNGLVELRTDNEHVVVTETHRVVTSLVPLRTALAGTLQRGQAVAISGGSVRELIDVRCFAQSSQVVEVIFTPDEPVETFPLPINAVLTMGQRRRSPVRRSRMNQRGAFRHDVDYGAGDDVLTYDSFR